MELFGLFLSVPVSFCLTALYCVALSRLATNSRFIRAIFPPASYAVLGLLALEQVMVLAFDAARCNELGGWAFRTVHWALFFLGIPALANLLVLRATASAFRRWYVVAILCAALDVPLVLLHYSVMEGIYGING